MADRTPARNLTSPIPYRALVRLKVGERYYEPGELLPVDQTQTWAPSVIRACLNTKRMAAVPESALQGRKRPFRIADVAHLGGIARRERLTDEERSESARQAVIARHQRSTKKQRQEAARRAVQARWAKAKETRNKS